MASTMACLMITVSSLNEDGGGVKLDEGSLGADVV